ncbi:hypothetical protein SMC26_21530 [Actinomadura fulvescens]|uniref:Uncharacterized protein n=1 Tax=Actinomadura fulvescens TaxID=46160 RepID=A0ABN3QPX1_9ACTN
MNLASKLAVLALPIAAAASLASPAAAATSTVAAASAAPGVAAQASAPAASFNLSQSWGRAWGTSSNTLVHAYVQDYATQPSCTGLRITWYYQGRVIDWDTPTSCSNATREFWEGPGDNGTVLTADDVDLQLVITS